MKQDEVLSMMHDIIAENRQYSTWTVSTPHLVMLVNRAIEAEREACLALHDHEDVLAPVGASSWGEAYQEGWAKGAAAYHAAIRARGEQA